MMTFGMRVPSDLKEKLVERAIRHDRALDEEARQIRKAAG
jgi:plasmid stability protein